MNILKFLLGGACAALAACGGGGGGGGLEYRPGPPLSGGPLVLTGANYVTVAQESLSSSINSLSGSLDSFPHEASLTVGFNQLTARSALTTSTAHGTVTMDLRAAADNDRFISVTTAPSFTESSTSGGLSYSRTLSSYTGSETLTPSGTGYLSSVSANGTLSSTALGGSSIGIATPQAFVRNGSDRYPSSGQATATATATGAGGGKVLITVIDNSTVRIELDANGDGSIEAATVKAWGELV